MSTVVTYRSLSRLGLAHHQGDMLIKLSNRAMRDGDKKLLALALVFVVSIALTVGALYMAATS
jgi:hypothetical protein